MVLPIMIKKGNLYFRAKRENKVLLRRHGSYYPTKEFQKRAWLSDRKIYQQANENPIKFWEKLAREIYWRKEWRKDHERSG